MVRSWARRLFTALLVVGISAGTIAIHQQAMARSAKSETVGLAATVKSIFRSDGDVAGGSLWKHLRRNFTLPEPDPARVGPYLDSYRSRPWSIERLLGRGKDYLAWITSEVERRKLPAEIALLPALESGFDPYARSHGGAAGLWQFIPATARRFGLKDNWWYEGRRDVTASTEAALDYLEYLHRRFDGDWLLALAAYNSGEGKVRSAIRNNRRAGKPDDFWHLKLPRETRDYVPRLLALRMVVEQPDRYGMTLPEIGRRPAVDVVDAGGQIDLALAAELAGIQMETLYRLNPAFNHWATAPDGPHRILVPADQADALRTALANLEPTERLQWARHKVETGETLSHIAVRYQTTMRVLRQANGIQGDRIRAGKYLLIPVAQQNLDEYLAAANSHRSRWEKRLAEKRTKVIHGVRRGDTLWDLARQYGVSVKQIASWNGISTKNYLKPGQKLVLWVSRKGGQRTAWAILGSNEGMT